MVINLSKIHDNLVINEEYSYDESYLKGTDIKKLEQVKFEGKIFYDYNENLQLTGICKGEMILLDNITLDPINYPFEFEIDYEISENNPEIYEYFEKTQNTLDIMGVLWQNIVLEVPMRITNSSIDDIATEGYGWELINENKKEIDPRLAKLAELLEDTGKE